MSVVDYNKQRKEPKYELLYLGATFGDSASRVTAQRVFFRTTRVAPELRATIWDVASFTSILAFRNITTPRKPKLKVRFRYVSGLQFAEATLLPFRQF